MFADAVQANVSQQEVDTTVTKPAAPGIEITCSKSVINGIDQNNNHVRYED
jgi:hypothetical protein